MPEQDNNQQIIDALSRELDSARSTNIQGSMAAASYIGNKDANIIEQQIETATLLGNLEHFLKGDYITFDPERGEVWKSQTDKKLILFNQYGVNSIMAIVGQYIDKNTVLSYYQEERIYEILADLGEELSTFIFCNYEKMGMDTDFKKSRYKLVVLNMLHMIESSYRRAIRGKTADDINSSRLYTQHGASNPGAFPMPAKPRFSLFKPSTW